MDEGKTLLELSSIQAKKDALNPKRVLGEDFAEIKSIKKQIDDMRAMLEASKGMQEAHKKSIAALEAEIGGKEKYLREGEARLYESKGRSLRELLTIQQAIVTAEADLHADEDTYLKLLSELDTMKTKAEKAEVASRELKKAYNQKARDFKLKKEKLEIQIKVLEAEEEVIRKELPENTLRLYDDILRRVGQAPVTTVRKQTCQGCHIGVSDQQIRKIQFGGQWYCCENCGRILVMSNADGH
jgi:predicted  nucleic acid-binding Zn-ribbon protein